MLLCDEDFLLQSAKFVVTEESGQETTLSVFEPLLSCIVDGVDGCNLSAKLLMAPPKLFRFNDRKVVFYPRKLMQDGE